jgi:biotin carboxylase
MAPETTSGGDPGSAAARPRVAVWYALGAAGPAVVVRSASGLCEIVFVLDSRDAHTAAVLPIVDSLARRLDVAELDDTEIVDRLRALSVEGIVTFSDRAVRRTGALAHALGVPYNNPSAVDALTDKESQRRALNAAGVSATHYTAFAVDAPPPEAERLAVGLPAVMKPCRSAASAGLHFIRTAEEFEEAIESERERGVHGRFVLEEHIAGVPHPAGDWLADYVSVESIVHSGRVVHFCVTDRLPRASGFREGGLLVPSLLEGETRRDVEALATEALRALDVTSGMAHTEIKLTPAGPRIVEVNGRLGGPIHRLLTRVSDTDPVRLGLCAALGRTLPSTAPSFRSHACVVFVNPPADATRITQLPSAASYRQIPGVWAVQRRRAPGERIDVRDGALAAIQHVWIEAPRADDLRARVESVHHVAATESEYVRGGAT